MVLPIPVYNFHNFLTVHQPTLPPFPRGFETTKEEPAGSRKRFLIIYADKDPCGGIDSSVTKAARRAFANATDSPILSVSVVLTLGDKSKAHILRVYGNNFKLAFNLFGRDV
ncbi:hypothetical protein GYMLUDRAFT_73339 [Collybiopsis luxurians FD-317 M1]|uniref:Uncharacterized protein n=1 Tax=Collybiopsis luxurians FD-317 M1 TaxID=944289 RepID=A0A0D0BC73_9AGAR|nr:hypothetical protein GYMLUDRAFT_73339 [Collybiopsis luxurians FD-317 M1]